MGNRKLSLRTYLVLLMTGLLTLGLGIAGAYTSMVSRQVVDAMVEQTLADNTNRVAEQVSDLVAVTERDAELLGLLVEGADGLDDTDVVIGRLKELLPVMAKSLTLSKDLEFLSVTTQGTGELVQVSRGPGGEVLYQVNRRIGSEFRFEKVEYVVRAGKEIQLSRDDNWTLDSRTRPYFRAAVEAQRITWTEPYEFIRRAEEGAPTRGITCCKPIYDSSGRLLAVVTADISLDRLTGFLTSLEVGSTGYGFVYKGGEGSKGSILAEPKVENSVSLELLRVIGSSKTLASVVDTTTLDLGGEKYVVGWRATPPDSANWRVYAIAPQSDFTKALDAAGRTILSFGAWMLVVGAGVALLIAARISKALVELAGQARAIRELQVDQGEAVQSSIREVSDLGESVDSLRTGIQSFSRLVPKSYVRRLIRSNTEVLPGGDRRQITAFFADLNGFTALSESEELSKVFDILNEYLSFVSAEVQKEEGTIDKFLGDEVMAFWGAPDAFEDGPVRAVRTALSAKTRVSEVAERVARPVGLRIGIATGSMIVGNIGTRDRLNYTIVGDRANLASRLQNLNRVYGTTILVDDLTFEKSKQDFLFRCVDLVAVYGKDEAVQVYEPLSEELGPLVERTNRAFIAYQERQFAKAKILYYDLMLEYPDDQLLQIMMERCEAYERVPPPLSWGGVHQIRSK